MKCCGIFLFYMNPKWAAVAEVITEVIPGIARWRVASHPYINIKEPVCS